MCRGGVRTFRILEFRKRIVPFRLIETFGKAFLIHRKGVNMNVLYSCFHLTEQFVVHPVIHIADRDIRFGSFPGAQHFHPQFRASDTAAHKGGIENDGFHKAVSGTPQRLFLFRLGDASGGIGPAVDQKASLKAVYKQNGLAG